MKKMLGFFLALVLSTGTAYAVQSGTPEYDKLKAYKKAQREKRDAERANPAHKEKGFWAREAERSGFAGTGAMFTNAVFGAIPLDKPNSRKTE